MNSRTKGLMAAAMVFVLLVVAVGVWSFGTRADVVVGGKDFTEQLILTEMVATLIEENTDLTVGRKAYLGGTMICFNGLRGGALDMYAEYTGTALTSMLGEDAMNDPDKVYERVKTSFDEKYDLLWMPTLGFNNTYTLTMNRKRAEELGIKTYSDLAAHVNSGADPVLKSGFTAEFIDRPDGLKGLTAAYDFQFNKKPMQLDPGLMYKACADGEIDVICAFATDGRIAAFDLLTLQDDKKFFPPYQAAIVVRQDTLEKYPQLRKVLESLSGRIDDRTMQELNYKVDRKENPMRARQVAREFLLEQGLIKSN